MLHLHKIVKKITKLKNKLKSINLLNIIKENQI